jgi:hypothetical protein
MLPYFPLKEFQNMHMVLIGNSNINALPLKEAFTTLHGIIDKTTYSFFKVGNIGLKIFLCIHFL